MKSITLAKRYARALADVVGEKDKTRLEKITSELALLARVLEREPQIGRFFEDPSVRREDRESAAGMVAKKIGAGPLTRRFLDVLIENRRRSVLPSLDAEIRPPFVGHGGDERGHGADGSHPAQGSHGYVPGGGRQHLS